MPGRLCLRIVTAFDPARFCGAAFSDRRVRKGVFFPIDPPAFLYGVSPVQESGLFRYVYQLSVFRVHKEPLPHRLVWKRELFHVFREGCGHYVAVYFKKKLHVYHGLFFGSYGDSDDMYRVRYFPEWNFCGGASDFCS